MVDDRQTQTLPEAGPELDASPRFAGFKTTEAFAAAMLRHLGTVERHYADLFEEAPPLGGPGNLVFTGIDDDPETLATLGRLGFADGASVSQGHPRLASRPLPRDAQHARARAADRADADAAGSRWRAPPDPDIAFARFDDFLGHLPAGVQLFSLLHANPGLLDLVAEIMGGAPRLADHLSRHADLLEAVLARGFFDALPPPEALSAELAEALRQANDFQDVLDIVRRWTKDRQFQVGVRVLRHVSTPRPPAPRLPTSPRPRSPRSSRRSSRSSHASTAACLATASPSSPSASSAAAS